MCDEVEQVIRIHLRQTAVPDFCAFLALLSFTLKYMTRHGIKDPDPSDPLNHTTF